MIRIIDIVLIIIGFPVILIISIVVYCCSYFDTNSPIFSQERLGKNKQGFVLYKFRTMKLSTLSVGTHLVDKSSITSFGRLLRKTKLDELPQLVNVLKGEMSLVGPRPNLPNQIELIKEREKKSIYSVRPGITGLAQIRQIDMSTPELLAQTDAEMIKTMSIKNYFLYLWLTFIGKGGGDRVNSE